MSNPLEAFPYLDLRCQLLSGESCEEEAKPVVEFIVKDGTVTPLGRAWL